MAIGTGTTKAIKIVDAADDFNYGAGVVGYTTNARGMSRLSMQVIFANYTSVTVKIQASLDSTTWADVSGMSITSSDDIVSAEIGPYEEIRVHITATLSGSTDTLEVWLAKTLQPR